MAPRHRLTPIDEDIVLQHGMSFVVKWRNPGTNRVDFWIGIYVPEELSFTTRKEDDGKYMMYLPGRNI